MSGVSSAGLTTLLQPAASDGASLAQKLKIGPFQGNISPTTSAALGDRPHRRRMDPATPFLPQRTPTTPESLCQPRHVCDGGRVARRRR